MNVLLVTKYWRRLGGVEEYCFLLDEVLREQGHQVIPLAQAEPNSEPSEWSRFSVPPVDPTATGGSARLHAAGRAIAGRATVRAVERLLDEVQIDVAHVVHVYHQLGPAFLHVLRRRNIPVVLSIHDYKLCCPSYRLFDDTTNSICTKCLDAPWKAPIAPLTTRCWRGSAAGGALLGAEALATGLTRPYARAAGRVLVSNELMHRCAVAGGIPEDRIMTVPNFWPAPAERVPHTPGRHLVYVGRLVVEKGVDVLIRAAAAGDHPVRIVGDGPLRSDLESLAAELQAPVEFVGPRWGEDAEQEMRDAAALVIPSIWHEVSPLVAYQAITLDVPVIASEVGGMPDLLRDGRGRLVPPANVDALAAAMGAALADPAEGARQAARAAEFSDRYLSREAFVENIGRAYAGVGVTL